ncbi:hypothetical protein [Flavobacterium beibuense]|uniref:Uncharacterized protein n=1 Tax=Flavobacterium beibuense TaxID=657326 RepID=A0A444W6Q4_9FLAO|nr:hypothetical protein [Flavobacterium beibuense]RYJ41555.1 hypothetical protein NU09_2929 [Flavobacterium beibuense]
MDKIKLSLFDVFVYILPGSIILISIDLIKNPHEDFATYVFNSSKDFSLFQVAILLSLSYLFGFLNQYISYEVFKFLAKRIWRKRLTGKETSIGKLEDKITLIRHFSPQNFNILNMWLVLRGMCYSLFVALLFLFLVDLCRAVQLNCFFEQLLNLSVLLISLLLFLRRSVRFHEWAHGIINNSISQMSEFNKS